MSGVRLTGDWKRLAATFANLAQPGLLAAAHKRIAEYGVSSTKSRFAEQRGPDGRRWIPSERALRTGGQTLVDTARLRNSITAESDAAHAAWGTNVVYAAVHQYGNVIVRGRRGGGNPARPFVGINSADRAEIREIVSDTLGGVVT